MSKLTVLFSAVLMLLLSQKNYAQTAVCQMQYEAMNCGAGEVKQISHIGNLRLDKTVVLQKLWIVGDLSAKLASLQDSEVIGRSSLEKIQSNKLFHTTGDFLSRKSNFYAPIKINGNYSGVGNQYKNQFTLIGDATSSDDHFYQKVFAKGSFKATSSLFDKLLELDGCQLELDNVKSQTLMIKARQHCPAGKQAVILKNHSIVNGDIVFQEGNGKVVSSDGSLIKGSIVGGYIEN